MYTHSGKPNTRIDVADILRGIAIGGIILIHFIEHMNFYSFPEPSSALWAKVNQAVWDSTFFLLAGKMYAIFAMLFGLSFYIQHDNQVNLAPPCGFQKLVQPVALLHGRAADTVVGVQPRKLPFRIILY